MKTPASILAHLRPLCSVDGFDAMERFLRDPATRLHESKSDGRVTVEAIDHAWGTRLLIARNKGINPAAGSEHLVQALARLPKATILSMVALEGPSGLGAVWFVEGTDDPVGFVVGDRRATIGSIPN